MGQSPPSSTYNKKGEGLPFYQGNADFGDLNPTSRIYCNSPLKIAKENDLLISVRAPVGELNIANHRCCIGRGIAAIRSKTADSWFLFYSLNLLKNSWVRERTTFEEIKTTHIKNKSLAWPKPEERKKIIEILSTIDRKVELERNEKSRLERIKQGLMDLLLTGKIRVRL